MRTSPSMAARRRIVYENAGQVSSARTGSSGAIETVGEEGVSDSDIAGASHLERTASGRLVDELQLFFVPWVVGGGNQALPDNVRMKLELLSERRFRSGVVHLHYRIES